MKLALPIYVYALLIVVMIGSYLPLFFGENILDAFAREDQIFETLGAIYLFVAGILYVIVYRRFGEQEERQSGFRLKRLSLLALAAFSIIAAGEEISWGQRILGIETPEAIKEVSAQDEITLHNLTLFQGDERILPVSPSQIFIAFIFAFGLGIPILAAISKRAFDLLDSILPVVPISLGTLFLVNYGLQKFMVRFLPANPQLYRHPTLGIAAAVHEIREHDYALVFMVLAIYVAFFMLQPRGEADQEKIMGQTVTSRIS